MGGNVKIINYTADADSLVSSAGRISTTQGSAGEIYERACGREKEENVSLIRKILSSGHKSVLEHVSVNLAFDNVSVFAEQFMIEFRLASFTVKSRRYVDFGQMGYYEPDFSGKEELSRAYRAHMDGLFSEYGKLVAAGVPKEDARFLLPYCFRSNFYCTLNARELAKVIGEMLRGRGSVYPELVSLGRELKEQAAEIFPFLVEEAAAPEDEIRAFFTDRGFGGSAEVSTGDGAGIADGGSAEVSLGGAGIADGGSAEVSPGGAGLVELLSGSGSQEEMILRAAALRFGAEYGADAGNAGDAFERKALFKALLKGGRKRELEQAHFTFRFNRISLAGVTHLVRHRMQSIVIPDYSEVYDFGARVLPDSIVRAGLAERYLSAFEKSREMLGKMLSEGMYEKDCVYFLLSGMTVPVLTTMNANELAVFMRLRTCNRAQWEIRRCAEELLSLLRERCPALFSLYGPGCYMLGRCPEGRMSCGRMGEMCGKYGEE